MSRGTDRSITHWLRATGATGGVCGSSADHPSYGPGFRAAHERAGHTVTRHSLDEIRAERDAREAQRPALVLSRSEAAPVTPAVTQPEPEPELPLPDVGLSIVTPERGTGQVLAHLRFPPAHQFAGRRAAQVRYPDGEGLVWPGAYTPYTPPPLVIPPVIFETPSATYIQPSLF